MSFFVSPQDNRIALAWLVSMTCRLDEDGSKGLVVWRKRERVDGQVRNICWFLFVGYVYAWGARHGGIPPNLDLPPPSLDSRRGK